MKKLFISLSVAFALVSFVVLEAGSWSLDAGHSRLGFTVKHMGVSETVGQFDKFDVKVTTPNADFSGATIELTAEAKTINTYLFSAAVQPAGPPRAWAAEVCGWIRD